MKLKNLLYILIVITIIGNINVSAESITENGITVTLLENTNFCDINCFSVYEVCYTDVNLKLDFDIKFMDTENVIYDELDKYTYFHNQIIDDKYEKIGCQKITVHGNKGKFESIDNIPIIKGTEFKQFAWWNTSYPFRFRIFTTIKTPDMFFNVIDINYWNNNKTIMYKYCKNSNCNESVSIGNKTHELYWENGTSGIGYNPELVFPNYKSGVYHIDGSGLTARDSSINNENGIIDLRNANGVFGGGLQYTTDLHTGNITIPFNSSGAFTFNQNLTACAWFNFTDYDTTGGKTIVSKGNFGNWATVEWLIVSTGFKSPKGELDFNYKNPSGTTTYQKKVDQVLTNNQFHHVCGIIDETGEIYIYLDGLLQTPTATSGTKSSTWDNESSPQQPLRIGAEGRGGGGTTGIIDDVYVINAVMDSDWVKDLYDSGFSIYGGIEFYNISVVTFDVTDINGIDLINFNIICNNNYSYIGASSPHIDNLTYGSYNCSFTKGGFITEELNFILDDSFHNLSVTMRELRGIDVIVNFDMKNSYYVGECINDYTLQRTWNKTSCIEGECSNLYEIEFINCPYGCIEEMNQFGDDCSLPDWLMYLLIIVFIILMLIVLTKVM